MNKGADIRGVRGFGATGESIGVSLIMILRVILSLYSYSVGSWGVTIPLQ